MSKLWVTYGPGIDANIQPQKASLITPNAHGVVLDIGAGKYEPLRSIIMLIAPSGHGHTANYLDKARVTQYIALEPNVFMHPQLRATANAAGFHESDGTLLILSCGAEDSLSILSSLGNNDQHVHPHHGVDTLISVLTLCSVPSPQRTLTTLVTDVLHPGGKFLFFEHVLNPKADVAWWQRFWAPVWSLIFDGCRLDRPTDTWSEGITDEREESVWDEQAVWSNPGDPEDALLHHRMGRMVKRA
ncbi:hypothetical protein DXG01_003748 [Tephrocybe rancida]|nr:hypothetical protein DXG01_003748 [Tephrocybe rancida]